MGRRAHLRRQEDEKGKYNRAQKHLKATVRRAKEQKHLKEEEFKWAAEEQRYELLKEACRRGMTLVPEHLDEQYQEGLGPDSQAVRDAARAGLGVDIEFEYHRPKPLATAMQYLTSM